MVEIAIKVKNPEKSGEYPESIYNVRLRGLYDILDKNAGYPLMLYDFLNSEIPIDFMESKMKQREFKILLNKYVNNAEKAEEIFNLWKNTNS